MNLAYGVINQLNEQGINAHFTMNLSPIKGNKNNVNSFKIDYQAEKGELSIRWTKILPFTFITIISKTGQILNYSSLENTNNCKLKITQDNLKEARMILTNKAWQIKCTIHNSNL